jgi:mRNA-degrading endonuclease RelE of RelBE toxin-antitoxin system
LKKTSENLIFSLKHGWTQPIRNLETNPYIGKPLRGELSGKWSLRIGDFRIIYTIDERQKTVTLYSFAIIIKPL